MRPGFKFLKFSKKSVALSLIFIWLHFFIMSGQAPDSAAIAQPSGPSGQKRNFLWQADHSGSTVYIFGSVHLGRSDLYPLPQAVNRAFESSGILAVEIDTSRLDPLEVMTEFLQRGMYAPGERLQDNISGETFRLLDETLGRLGQSIDFFSMYKPWFLAINLMTVKFVQMGLDPSLGVDEHFISRAVSAGKPIVQLESLDIQLELFSGLSRGEQELFLLSTLIDMGAMEAEFERMLECWINGDTVEFERIMFQSIKKDPRVKPIFEKMFTERNHKMVEKIEGYLKSSDNYFVVVGAGHLVGESSIIDLLRRKGYNLRQL